MIPGLGRSPGEGNGNPLQYSCLENPMNRGTWWATWGRRESDTTECLRDFTFTFTFSPIIGHGLGCPTVYTFQDQVSCLYCIGMWILNPWAAREVLGKVTDTISILNLLILFHSLSLAPSLKVFRVHLRRVCIQLLLDEMFYICLLSSFNFNLRYGHV